MNGSYFGLKSLEPRITELISIARISRGIFLPENITAYYINNKNEKIYTLKELSKYLEKFPLHIAIKRYKIILNFDLNGMRYSVRADEAASTAAAQINHLIIETGYQFYLGSRGEPTPMLLLTQPEQEKLREERDLQVRLIPPRVEELIFTYDPSSCNFDDDEEIDFETSSFNFNNDDDEISFLIPPCVEDLIFTYDPSSFNFNDDDEIDFEPSSFNFKDDDDEIDF